MSKTTQDSNSFMTKNFPNNLTASKLLGKLSLFLRCSFFTIDFLKNVLTHLG